MLFKPMSSGMGMSLLLDKYWKKQTIFPIFPTMLRTLLRAIPLLHMCRPSPTHLIVESVSHICEKAVVGMSVRRLIVFYWKMELLNWDLRGLTIFCSVLISSIILRGGMIWCGSSNQCNKLAFMFISGLAPSFVLNGTLGNQSINMSRFYIQPRCNQFIRALNGPRQWTEKMVHYILKDKLRYV